MMDDPSVPRNVPIIIQMFSVLPRWLDWNASGGLETRPVKYTSPDKLTGANDDRFTD